MSNQTNEELAFAYQLGDQAALLPLWLQVEKLARLMIRRYLGLARRNRAVDYEDLLQAAFLAVESAASVYRDEAGAFSTVMQYYVQNECRRAAGSARARQVGALRGGVCVHTDQRGRRRDRSGHYPG